MPIKMKYQKERLALQLLQATNGYTVNICYVPGSENDRPGNGIRRGYREDGPSLDQNNYSSYHGQQGYAGNEDGLNGQDGVTEHGNGNAMEIHGGAGMGYNLDDHDAEGEAETPLFNGGGGAGTGLGIGVAGSAAGNGMGTGTAGQDMVQLAARRASSFSMQMPQARKESGGGPGSRQ